ncbi:MAG: hypothetical protein ACI8QZ_001259 [Chlamydiales bacterium]|jgi:hypothetical protein
MDEEHKYTQNPGAKPGGSWPRRVRVSIEGAWKEATKLAETLLDTLALPAGGFSIIAFGWMTSVGFFALSIAVGVVVATGGLLLFIGLECLALMAYAYPGALFLVAVAGSLAPPLVLYWLLHSLLGIEGGWTDWGAYPLLLTGLFGSYYYWRFGRVIAVTGAGAVAFYRGAAPKANEIFGAPFAIFAGVWDVIKLVLGLFRRVAGEFFGLLGRRARRADPQPSPTEDPGSDEPSASGP